MIVFFALFLLVDAKISYLNTWGGINDQPVKNGHNYCYLIVKADSDGKYAADGFSFLGGNPALLGLDSPNIYPNGYTANFMEVQEEWKITNNKGAIVNDVTGLIYAVDQNDNLKVYQAMNNNPVEISGVADATNVIFAKDDTVTLYNFKTSGGSFKVYRADDAGAQSGLIYNSENSVFTPANLTFGLTGVQFFITTIGKVDFNLVNGYTGREPGAEYPLEATVTSAGYPLTFKDDKEKSRKITVDTIRSIERKINFQINIGGEALNPDYDTTASGLKITINEGTISFPVTSKPLDFNWILAGSQDGFTIDSEFPYMVIYKIEDKKEPDPTTTVAPATCATCPPPVVCANETSTFSPSDCPLTCPTTVKPDNCNCTVCTTAAPIEPCSTTHPPINSTTYETTTMSAHVHKFIQIISLIFLYYSI